MTTYGLIVFFKLFIAFQCLELSIQSLVVSQLTTPVPASTAKKSVSVMCVCNPWNHRDPFGLLLLLFLWFAAGECGVIVGPHSTKLPQSRDTESDQLDVPASF